MPEGKKMIMNPDKGLIRYEFLELILRMAIRKYLAPKIATTKAEALEMLMKTELKNVIDSKIQRIWKESSYWTEENDTLYKIYFKVLHYVFAEKYGPKATEHDINMSRSDLKKFSLDIGLQNDCCGEQTCEYAFNLSK